MSDVYCHESGLCAVEYLDLSYLKEILKTDEDKLMKLWSILTQRLIMINHEKLPEFKFIQKEKIRMFVKMCEVKKYAPGDIIDLSLGGICFRGGFKEMGQDIDQAEKTINKIETEQKKLDYKFKDALQVNSEAHNNASYLASRK